MLNKVINWLLSQGVQEGLTKMQKQDIRFINAEAMIVFLLCIPSVPICYFFFPNKNYDLILFCLFSFYLSAILLNRFHLYEFAKISILLVAEISLFWAVSTFGKESNLHYVFVILVFAAVITFQNSNKGYLFFILGIAILLLSILYINDFSLFYRENLSPLQIEIVQLTSFTLCFLASVVIASFYINKFSMQKQIIEKYNIELTNKQVEIEEQNDILKQKSKALEKSNAIKEKIFGIIGHDLRSPINALKGTMYLLANKNISTEEFMLLSHKLQNSVDHIHFTLNNLLEWAYAQMKGIVTKPIMTNLFVLGEENFNFLGQLASAKQITLSNQISVDLEAYIDPHQINLVFRNLISNAIKFTPPKGSITLKSMLYAEFCEISIIDTGLGMSAENVSKLFSKTTHFTTYGTTGEKGTGLGLLLCQEMVENNNGTISVESQVGKGTIFRFILPLK